MKIRTISLNNGCEMIIHPDYFKPEYHASASRVVKNHGGEFLGPAGKCQAKISRCGGSALMSLEESASGRALGIAVVTWSEALAQFVWAELLRAHAESEPQEIDPCIPLDRFELSKGPRLGTLIWPFVERSTDDEGLFLLGANFGVLGLAIVAEINGNTN
jgi:hypothetical protein